jgi:hypothetical protein
MASAETSGRIAPTGANAPDSRSNRLGSATRQARTVKRREGGRAIETIGEGSRPVTSLDPEERRSTTDAGGARCGGRELRRHRRRGRGRGRRHRHRPHRRGAAAAGRRPVTDSTFVTTTTPHRRDRRAQQDREGHFSHEHSLIPPPEQRGGRSFPPTPRARGRPSQRQRVALRRRPFGCSGSRDPMRRGRRIDTTLFRRDAAPAPGCDGRFGRASLLR